MSVSRQMACVWDVRMRAMPSRLESYKGDVMEKWGTNQRAKVAHVPLDGLGWECSVAGVTSSISEASSFRMLVFWCKHTASVANNSLVCAQSLACVLVMTVLQVCVQMSRIWFRCCANKQDNFRQGEW